MVNMDTDSSYVALSGPLLDVIRPDRIREFLNVYGQWYVQPYCPQHARDFADAVLHRRVWRGEACCEEYRRWDSRTPGKFKVEFEGDVICALNAKTYLCQALAEREDQPPKTKLSSKGLSKRTNSLQLRDYKSVLFTRQPKTGVNTGFVRKNNRTYTYRQIRTGLTYFYSKRKVLADGVSTTHLNI